MTTQQRNQDDIDRIDQLELALHHARTMFHAQIKELGNGSNHYLESLASVGMDICEVALNTTTAEIETRKPDNNQRLN